MMKTIVFLHVIDDMGRAAARSDQEVSRQLPQASASLRQRSGRTV